jgi:hypothetical protein
MPQLLRDILRDALTGQPDIVLVPEIASGNDLRGAIERASGEVVITGLDVGANRTFWEPLLRRNPRLTVFSVREDGSGAFGWTLRLHGEPLGDVSPDGLLEAIRVAVRQPVEGR